jgi:hypothetical protein
MKLLKRVAGKKEGEMKKKRGKKVTATSTMHSGVEL